MSTQDEHLPDDVPEADYLEQQAPADGSDDEPDLMPDLDREDDADVADLQAQATPAPDDDDDRR
jgi:hypothetical protein